MSGPPSITGVPGMLEDEARARNRAQDLLGVQPWATYASPEYIATADRLTAHILEASRDLAALRERVAGLEGDRDAQVVALAEEKRRAEAACAVVERQLREMTNERDGAATAWRVEVEKCAALRAEVVGLREALERIRDAGPCECGPVSSDGDVIGEHGHCYIGIADRALAATVLEVGGEMLVTPGVPLPPPLIPAARGETLREVLAEMMRLDDTGVCDSVVSAWDSLHDWIGQALEKPDHPVGPEPTQADVREARRQLHDRAATPCQVPHDRFNHFIACDRLAAPLSRRIAETRAKQLPIATPPPGATGGGEKP